MSLFFCVGTASGQTTPSFGPQVFTRTSAARDVFSQSFSVQDTTIPYNLIITNGQTDGSQRVKKGWVTLNGATILSPRVFRASNSTLSLAILPQQQNTIVIKLKGGAAGSFVTLSVAATPSTVLNDPGSPGFDASETGLGMPYGVAIDQATHLAYVADRFYDSAVRFDIQSARISGQFTGLDGDSVNGDGGTTGIEFDSTSGEAVAANEGVTPGAEGSIAVIDSSTGSVRTLPILDGGVVLHADYVGVNPQTGIAAFCPLYYQDRVPRFIDLTSGQIQDGDSGMHLTSAAFNNGTGQFLFAGNDAALPPAIVVYGGTAPFHESYTISSTAPSGAAFAKLAIDQVDNLAVAINPQDQTASVFDLGRRTEIARIPVSLGSGVFGSFDVAINPATRMAAVVSSFTSRLVVIDLNTLLVSEEIPLPAGTRPLGVDIDQGLNQAVVSENGLTSNTRNGTILVVQMPSR